VCFALFFAGFRQDSPGFLGGPQGCPRQINRQHFCPVRTRDSIDIGSPGTICDGLAIEQWAHEDGAVLYYNVAGGILAGEATKHAHELIVFEAHRVLGVRFV
jgi:hypothetical protein